jgi:hypothetical protein
MLTTTGRVLIIAAGALIGLGAGIAIAITTSIPFAPEVGAAIGVVAAYAVTRLWN